MLLIENLSKKYKNKIILNNFNLLLKDGEILLISGENGCGKSTLLKMISTLINYDSGKISISDYDCKKNRNKYLKNLGAFIETPLLYDTLSGYENLKILSRIKGNDNLDTIINIFSTTSFIHEKVENYSLGMKQKIGIMMAFINLPKVVLLDEPFNSLDSNSKLNLVNYIKDYSKLGNIIIIISHQDRELLNFINFEINLNNI